MALSGCGSEDKARTRLAASAFLRADDAAYKSDAEFSFAITDLEKATDVITDGDVREDLNTCRRSLELMRSMNQSAMSDLQNQERRGHSATDAEAKKAFSRSDPQGKIVLDCWARIRMAVINVNGKIVPPQPAPDSVQNAK